MLNIPFKIQKNCHRTMTNSKKRKKKFKSSTILTPEIEKSFTIHQAYIQKENYKQHNGYLNQENQKIVEKIENLENSNKLQFESETKIFLTKEKQNKAPHEEFLQIFFCKNGVIEELKSDAENMKNVDIKLSNHNLRETTQLDGEKNESPTNKEITEKHIENKQEEKFCSFIPWGLRNFMKACRYTVFITLYRFKFIHLHKQFTEMGISVSLDKLIKTNQNFHKKKKKIN